jgi:hypothetical protein
MEEATVRGKRSEREVEKPQKAKRKKIVDYTPLNTNFDFEALKKEENFKVRRFGDAEFLGEIRAGLRFGLGIMKYSSGRVYEGYWEEDLRSGNGFERYANSNIYIGQFKKGKAHGKGKYSFNNDTEYYDGEW